MHTIKNLTRQVVLLRFNSGTEVNIAPGAKLDVAPSELRGNKTISKLKRLGVIQTPDEEAPGTTARPSRAKAAVDDEPDDKDENGDSPRREAESNKRRR